MQTQLPARVELPEQAGYFSVPGAHIYTVLHQATDPAARVLLVGPFASERHFSYYTWIRWARYLAARGMEVLRFDYRGIGESTGNFEESGFESWSEDVELLGHWIRSRSPAIPLLVHGLELGAILAARNFHRGIGDALLLWSPPANANLALRSILRRWAGMEQFYESPENRKSASEYVRQLEQGSAIEVYGYQWPCRLWRDSSHFALPPELQDERSSYGPPPKPVKIVKFGKDADSPAMPYARYEEGQDLGWLYARTFDWIEGALALPTGEHHAGYARED